MTHHEDAMPWEPQGCTHNYLLLDFVAQTQQQARAAHTSQAAYVEQLRQAEARRQDEAREAENKKAIDEALEALKKMKEQEAKENEATGSKLMSKKDIKEERLIYILRNTQLSLTVRVKTAISIVILNPYNQESISFLQHEGGLTSDKIEQIRQKSPYYDD